MHFIRVDYHKRSSHMTVMGRAGADPQGGQRAEHGRRGRCLPSVYASGGKVFHGRLTKQGNKWLCWALIEYERLRHRKGPNAAQVATARRLLTIVYRVLSQGRPYEARQRPGKTIRYRARTAPDREPPIEG
jgi:hypothetical protein